jgi:hypothetical protein
MTPTSGAAGRQSHRLVRDARTATPGRSPPAPSFLLRNKNGPHAFTAAQIGRYDTRDTARNAGHARSCPIPG